MTVGVACGLILQLRYGRITSSDDESVMVPEDTHEVD